MRKGWLGHLTALKIRVFQGTIVSALLHGCEVWSLTVTMEKFPSGKYTRMLRRVRNTCRRDRVTNAELYGDLPIFVTIHDQIQAKAWSCWPLPPSPRIASKSASLFRTLTPRWPSVYIHRWMLGWHPLANSLPAWPTKWTRWPGD